MEPLRTRVTASVLSRAWQDTLAVAGARVAWGALSTGLAVLIIWTITRQTGAVWGLLSFPATFVVIDAFFLIRNAFGWNGMWTPVLGYNGGEGPLFGLRPRPRATNQVFGHRFVCEIETPSGWRGRVEFGVLGTASIRDIVGGFRFPGYLKDAPKGRPVSGIYKMTWLEETKPARFRLLLRHQAYVDMDNPDNPTGL
jgi:hypothetical protein